MPSLKISSLLKCMNTCKNDTAVGTPQLGTKVHNLSDQPVEIQIRVGSILKKVHTLKPGSSKRLKSKAIYKAYMPQVVTNNSNGKGMKNNKYMYYYDETCLPYVWIHESGGNFSRMVKQQYISLEDLRDSSEIRVYRDHQRGCISVRKKPRVDFCTI
ncbi:uncharacterized protein LOC141642409 [Silene latifolia]|uniref:uncharacterized protein LOC141642409 n=1 Tax=Silene latifolia TaxID=37657 RepID=UPI003D770A6E